MKSTSSDTLDFFLALILAALRDFVFRDALMLPGRKLVSFPILTIYIYQRIKTTRIKRH